MTMAHIVDKILQKMSVLLLLLKKKTDFLIILNTTVVTPYEIEFFIHNY